MMKLSINVIEENYNYHHIKEETLMLRIVMLSVIMMNHVLLSEEAPFFIQIVVVSNMHKKFCFFKLHELSIV
jgi:hypothetical protein